MYKLDLYCIHCSRTKAKARETNVTVLDIFEVYFFFKLNKCKSVKVPRIANVPKRIELFSQTQTFQI